jgi:solute carrier family 31 (copper transporter), member 1
MFEFFLFKSLNIQNGIGPSVFCSMNALLIIFYMLYNRTFQAGFIISIAVGLGVGEMLFGRYTNAAAHLF